MPRGAITSNETAPPVGPFSQAIRAGDFVFLSGEVAQSPATGKLIAGDVSSQTEQIFRNLQAVLPAAGKTLADVVQ
jgi:2-iminobutanoate/2-iminopropanoate deaminase